MTGRASSLELGRLGANPGHPVCEPCSKIMMLTHGTAQGIRGDSICPGLSMLADRGSALLLLLLSLIHLSDGWLLGYFCLSAAFILQHEKSQSAPRVD